MWAENSGEQITEGDLTSVVQISCTTAQQRYCKQEQVYECYIDISYRHIIWADLAFPVSMSLNIERSVTQRSDDGWGSSLFIKLADRGGHHSYPLYQWNGNLLAVRGSVTCCLQTNLQHYYSHRITKTGQQKIAKTLPGLMSLDFFCGIQM